jgi:hypothetical protein
MSGCTISRPTCAVRIKVTAMHGKVKVKLSLWFDWVPRHEGVWGSGGISPTILDLGTRWRWVVSFTPRPLYPQGKSPWYPLNYENTQSVLRKDFILAYETKAKAQRSEVEFEVNFHNSTNSFTKKHFHSRKRNKRGNTLDLYTGNTQFESLRSPFQVIDNKQSLQMIQRHWTTSQRSTKNMVPYWTSASHQLSYIYEHSAARNHFWDSVLWGKRNKVRLNDSHVA